MKNFFKVFFASLLAMIVFFGLLIMVLMGIINSALSSSNQVNLQPNSILVIDLTNPILEQKSLHPLNTILRNGPGETQGLFHLVGLIHQASINDNIKGIYLKLGIDPNGFATSEELRNALLEFKKSNKFIYAYGDDISQKSYYVASVANKIFLNPKGLLDFRGLSVNIMFLKGLLDKLEIHPQIFYDGKFKSATEPLRVFKMTEANKIQTKAFLGDLYNHFLLGISKERHIDTSTLFNDANNGLIQEPSDALKYHLVDELKYDDQVMTSIKNRLGLSSSDKINFISPQEFNRSLKPILNSGAGNIAVIFAQGDIVDGNSKTSSSGSAQISAGQYVTLIRKLREDKNINAIVLRVNSPGGSALAAEEIWRELSLAKKEKPVIVSMGDYAASGGYYISCMADSIFAEPNTLTGSIGVFGIIPDFHQFFKDKLGITFDGVTTAQYADMFTSSEPLSGPEKRFIQNSVDTTYANFKDRVVQGRKLKNLFVDSIAQGRVWSGQEAEKIGLVDKMGNIEDAIKSAAKMANLKHFNV
ncbi:MAG: signal peptide peptidase SppA, partial [Chitinophagaceae bacterium]